MSLASEGSQRVCSCFRATPVPLLSARRPTSPSLLATMGFSTKTQASRSFLTGTRNRCLVAQHHPGPSTA